jgi:hypothetical protein
MKDNEKENEGMIAKLSPEAALLNTIMTTRNKFTELDFEDFNEVEPEDVMMLIVGTINILNIAVNCADKASPESMDAFVYLQTALCHHEGLVNHIRDWNPGEKFLDESAQKVVDQINEIRPLLCEVFDACHNRFHDDKIIDLGPYEKDINKLMMALGRLEGVEAVISGNDPNGLRYNNISNEDAIAVVKMAADMEMEELHDFEVAQAAASYVNSNLKDGKTAKDLDTFDLMNACLGYKVLDMNKNGQEELQEFISEFINRDQEVSDEKYKKREDGQPNKMFARVPSYPLSGNRLLVFEPDKFTTEIPEEAVEAIKEKVNEKIMRGLSYLLELTSKDKVPTLLLDLITGKKEFEDGQALVVKESLCNWLEPWAGKPINIQIQEEGKEDKKTITVFEGSCIFGAIDGFLNSDKGKESGFCSFPVELTCILGILWKKGPEQFIDNFLHRGFELDNAIEGSNFFKAMLKDHGFEVDLDTKARMVKVTRK